MRVLRDADDGNSDDELVEGVGTGSDIARAQRTAKALQEVLVTRWYSALDTVENLYPEKVGNGQGVNTASVCPAECHSLC